ncbi:hypothetical protein GGR57DRAFT_488233 [Xylariaceae sp. FL1272]|nr:hypothetical protein GGR57DRAFT_488233 [Xylariaceae sp. FL1272]
MVIMRRGVYIFSLGWASQEGTCGNECSCGTKYRRKKHYSLHTIDGPNIWSAHLITYRLQRNSNMGTLVPLVEMCSTLLPI